MSAPSERMRVLRAFAYLRATSLVNAVRSRLRRLRQPKYLVGALLMTAYVGFFFVLPMALSRPAMPPWSPDVLALASGAAALLVAFVVATAWLLPGDRAAIAFSEAEVAFLFPAPLTRVALINFSLLRSQVAIFVSAFLVSVVLGRGRGLPGTAWQHATALWLLMATLRLHFLGASFAHERLFDAGWQPWLRRVLGGLLLLVAVGGVVGWISIHVRPPGEADLASGRAFGRWLGPVLAAPPANVILAPFHWLVAPMFTGGRAAWWWSLLPAGALLAAHYAWVVRSHVAFEEASMERTGRMARRAQAMREGRLLFRTGAASAQRSPFALSARGFAPVAFLWEGLIAAGAVARPRNVLVLLGAIAVVVFGLAQSP
ncbi:MAG: putative ABC exporter domain-containing protein, partial [Arenimonas sp.]